MDNLYYIENVGCDDTTRGLAVIPKETFEVLKPIIEELNKNSKHGCQPKIYVYEITKDDIHEATEYDSDWDIIHHRGRKYVLKSSWQKRVV